MEKALVPKRVFLTKGSASHRDKLVSFELALQDAQISGQNLVKVSSILPVGCEFVSIEEGKRYLDPGQITFCILGCQSSCIYNCTVGAAVGCAIPVDPSHYGVFSECEEENVFEDDLFFQCQETALDILSSLQSKPSWSFEGSLEDKVARAKEEGFLKSLSGFAHTDIVSEEGIYTTAVVAAVFSF